MSTGEVHAVRADYTTLCGATAVFVFLEREFVVSQTDAACSNCEDLASSKAREHAAA
jgi:hypothetical protein